MNSDTSELIDRNNEYMGWLYVPDVCNLPVVSSSDNTFYLTHDFDKNKNKYGSLFVDASYNEHSNNILIHGHNNFNGTMFSELTNYTDSDFYDSHKYVYLIDRKDNVKKYAAFAVINYNVSDKVQFNALTTALTQKTLDEIKENSLYHSDISLSSEQEFLTLSTCDPSVFGSNGRCVVYFVLS